MDECDMGKLTAERHLNAVLAGHKAQAKSSRQSRTRCLDCGEKIPEARRKAVAGCDRCVECQTSFEGRGNGS